MCAILQVRQTERERMEIKFEKCVVPGRIQGASDPRACRLRGACSPSQGSELQQHSARTHKNILNRIYFFKKVSKSKSTGFVCFF